MGKHSSLRFFLFLLLFLFLRFLPCAAVSLKMIISPSKTVVEDQKVHVSCYVDDMQPSDMRGFSLHFYCPVFSISTGIACYQNCSTSCGNSGCPQQRRLSEFACKRYVSGNSLTFEYTIPKARLDVAGDYRCTFMGKSTETLKLNVIKAEIIEPPVPKPPPTRKPVPTKAPTPPPPPPPTYRPKPPLKPEVKPSKRTIPDRVPGRPQDKDKNPTNYRDTEDGTIVEHTRRRHVRDLMRTGHSLFFVVILLFLFSLLINTVFFIRCVLIWFYSTGDAFHRPVRMGHLLCMSEEIRMLRERKGDHYSMLALPLGDPSVRPLLMHHPPGIARQHSADQPQLRVPYPHRPPGAPVGFQRSHSRPGSQHSNDSGPRVMRVISEIELQPGEVPEDQTIMYVKVPIMVQKNGSVTALNNGAIPGADPGMMVMPRANGHVAGGRPQSVFFQSGELEQVGQRSRLSTSSPSIDRIRSRSGRDGPERILSMESVFQMEPLHE